MFWSGQIFSPTPYAVWNDEPGGTVVERYTLDGIDYVIVEFENSPGRKYIYLAHD